VRYKQVITEWLLCKKKAVMTTAKRPKLESEGRQGWKPAGSKNDKKEVATRFFYNTV
jgi:hypothetical protein